MHFARFSCNLNAPNRPLPRCVLILLSNTVVTLCIFRFVTEGGTPTETNHGGFSLETLLQHYNLFPPEILHEQCSLGKFCNFQEFAEYIINGTMHIKSYERQLMQYTEFRIHKFLLLYVPPILLILGTIGNILSFVILRRKAMLKFSTYYYLAVLAVADTLVLLVGLLRLWIGELTGFDVKDRVDWYCKLTNVLGYTVSDFSVWLIIAVTVERFIVVCYPLKASSMCNIKRARKVILGLFVLMFLMNSHFFKTVGITLHPVGNDLPPVSKCDGDADHLFLIDHVWPWVDVCIYSFLPFIVIIILNGLIIRQVVHARRHRTAMQSWTTYEQRRPSHEGSTRLTLMLLTISFAFLLTTLPMNICNIATAFWNRNPIDMHQITKYKLARTLTELLMYVNHSMNFYLYCAMGQKFRHQLVWMMCYAKRTNNWFQRGSDQSQHSLPTKFDSVRVIKTGKRKSETTEVLLNVKNEINMIPLTRCAVVSTQGSTSESLVSPLRPDITTSMLNGNSNKYRFSSEKEGRS